MSCKIRFGIPTIDCIAGILFNMSACSKAAQFEGSQYKKRADGNSWKTETPNNISGKPACETMNGINIARVSTNRR